MAEVSLSWWRDKKVLVTGHSGFVGSWVSVTLLSLGASVTGLASSADADTLTRARWLGQLGVRDVRADIRDLLNVREALRSQRVDALIHLAAQPLVSAGYLDPYGTMHTNIGGSLTVLEAVRLHQVPLVLHVTSDKCYRNMGRLRPYREADELGAGCPYSTSKAAAELVFAGYARLYGSVSAGPRSVSLRFGNVIGGGDFAKDRLVPDCIRAFAAGRPAALRQPDAVRPFQHVLDVAHGLLRAGIALGEGVLEPGEVLNIGPAGRGYGAGMLASALAREWGGSAEVCAVAGAPFPEEAQLSLDSSKAADLLSWRHVFDIESSARSVVAWHRDYLAGRAAADCTAAQVAEFLATVTTTRAIR